MVSGTNRCMWPVRPRGQFLETGLLRVAKIPLLWKPTSVTVDVTFSSSDVGKSLIAGDTDPMSLEMGE
jgi:hypothetical protein